MKSQKLPVPSLSGKLMVFWGAGTCVVVTGIVELPGNVDMGVGVAVEVGELGNGASPLTGVECCTVLILISNDPSTPAIETMTRIMSIMVMILTMWFLRDIV